LIVEKRVREDMKIFMKGRLLNDFVF